MLFEYTLLLLAFSLVGMILMFDQTIEPVGRVFFMMMTGVLLSAGGLGLLTIDFKWAGSQNIIPYTFIPTNGEEWVPYAFVIISALLIVIAVWKATLLVLPKTKTSVHTYMNMEEG
jgi:hypothetical protein